MMAKDGQRTPGQAQRRCAPGLLTRVFIGTTLGRSITTRPTKQLPHDQRYIESTRLGEDAAESPPSCSSISTTNCDQVRGSSVLGLLLLQEVSPGVSLQFVGAGEPEDTGPSPPDRRSPGSLGLREQGPHPARFFIFWKDAVPPVQPPRPIVSATAGLEAFFPAAGAQQERPMSTSSPDLG